MIDTTELQAGRETDCLVAKCFGWTDVWISDVNGYGRLEHGGARPGKDVCFRTSIPNYSTTDAALEALEEMMARSKYRHVHLSIDSDEPDDGMRWFVECRESSAALGNEVAYGPTLYLAACRLIVAVMGPKGGDAL